MGCRVREDSGMDSLGALSRLDVPVGRTLHSAMCSGELGRRERFVALDRRPVGVLDGPQPGGDPRLAGGDGLAVAPAVGAFGQVLRVPLDLAEVGFALVGVRGDGVDGDVGSGGIEDEADRLAFGIAAGQGQYTWAVAFWPGLLREGAALPDPLAELGEHHVSPVDLIAGGSEVLAHRAEFGGPA